MWTIMRIQIQSNDLEKKNVFTVVVTAIPSINNIVSRFNQSQNCKLIFSGSPIGCKSHKYYLSSHLVISINKPVEQVVYDTLFTCIWESRYYMYTTFITVVYKMNDDAAPVCIHRTDVHHISILNIQQLGRFFKLCEWCAGTINKLRYFGWDYCATVKERILRNMSTRRLHFYLASRLSEKTIIIIASFICM